MVATFKRTFQSMSKLCIFKLKNFWHCLHETQRSSQASSSGKRKGPQGGKDPEMDDTEAKSSWFDEGGKIYKYCWFLNIEKPDNRIFRKESIISKQEHRCFISDVLSMENIIVWCRFKKLIWAAIEKDISAEFSDALEVILGPRWLMCRQKWTWNKN